MNKRVSVDSGEVSARLPNIRQSKVFNLNMSFFTFTYNIVVLIVAGLFCVDGIP